MTLLLQAAAFTLGVYLSIRMIAALHGTIDLWYAIGSMYPLVIGRIVAWGAAIVASVWLLQAPYRAALAWGLLGFLVFYLSLYVIRYPVLRALERRPDQP